MNALQVLGLAGCVIAAAAVFAYLAAWAAIGHEPLLARNCTCRERP
jgi:uncharacterized membrane protein YccC